MDWSQRMNKAMDYIESNLTTKISYDRISQIVCCSTYNFQRMFSFIADISLSEYIRRRRLTTAAYELQTSDTKVIDIAYKYGYASPEAFSRAFKSLHRITPKLMRNKDITLKTYPKMTFSIINKGGIEVNCQIEQDDTAVLKLKKIGELKNNKGILKDIIESIHKNDIVVLDFEGMDINRKRRYLDFSCGAITALGGEITQNGDNIFVLKKSSYAGI